MCVLFKAGSTALVAAAAPMAPPCSSCILKFLITFKGSQHFHFACGPPITPPVLQAVTVPTKAIGDLRGASPHGGLGLGAPAGEGDSVSLNKGWAGKQTRMASQVTP